MADFNQLFDQWAESYDNTVFGTDNEYKEVFENYNGILNCICKYIDDKRHGITLEIGIGTGNLTGLLAQRGHHVIGIEPSTEMRKLATGKLTRVTVLDGHFLDVPIYNKVDSIVTSYAFHHLTLEEKEKALVYLDGLLNEGGKIVIADTMFSSLQYKKDLYKQVEQDGAVNLLNDLNTEYYELLDDVTGLFEKLGYTYKVEQMNKYVWTILAQKGGKE